MEMRIAGETIPCHSCLPPWMKRRRRETGKTLALKKWLRARGLHTVCQSAGCPNLTECFEQPTVTFIILGNACTRHCRFCRVAKGKPAPVDREEPFRIADAVRQLRLNHVIITSVTRDDLVDGGSGHFFDTIRIVRNHSNFATVEVLVPDFRGSSASLQTVLDAGVDVFGHNVETVPRLYPKIRPEADFFRSLRVLKNAGKMAPRTLIKSGVMLGLGESEPEVIELLKYLLDSGCHSVTLGQYLTPSQKHYPVQEYVSPAQFEWYRQKAIHMGFQRVFSGPYVRSSYHAEEMMN